MIRKLSIFAALILAATPVSSLEAQPSEVRIGGKPRAFWITSLTSKDFGIRWESCEALGLLGPDAGEAVPALIATVDDPDQQVRWAAITALGEIGPAAQNAVPILLSRFARSTESLPVRQALSGIGRPVVPELTRRLAHESETRKIWLVEILGWIGPDAEVAVPALIAELDTARDRPRYLYPLVETLGCIGPAAKPAAPTLTRLLAASFVSDGKENLALPEKLNLALAAIGEPPVPLLLERLASRESDELAIELLGRIGPGAKAAGEKLFAILFDPHLPERIRRTATIALSRIDPDSVIVVPKLIEAIDQDPAFVIAALRDLGPRANRAVPHLIKMLDVEAHAAVHLFVDHPNRLAVLALPQIDPEGLQCLPAIIRMFENSNGVTRALAAGALSQFGPNARASVPSLMRTFLTESANDPEDADLAIRDNIALALREIASHPRYVVPTMISILKNQEKPDRHRNALIALSGYGPAAAPAIPQLMTALEGPWRVLAAEVLGQIGPNARESLPALRACLKQNQAPENQTAMWKAILRIDPSSAAGAEVELASIDNLYARAVMSTFLGRASPEGEGFARRYLKQLDGMLDRMYEPDFESTSTLERQITMLGSLGPSARAAIPQLSSLLTHKDRSIRLAAGDALARIEMTRRP